MKKTQPSKHNYPQEFLEHQNKQYLPGYYLGGKIPLMFRAKTKAGAYWLIFLAVIYLFSTIVSFLYPQNSSNSNRLINLIVSLILITLTLLAAKAIFKSRKKL